MLHHQTAATRRPPGIPSETCSSFEGLSVELGKLGGQEFDFVTLDMKLRSKLGGGYVELVVDAGRPVEGPDLSVVGGSSFRTKVRSRLCVVSVRGGEQFGPCRLGCRGGNRRPLIGCIYDEARDVERTLGAVSVLGE